MDFVKHYKEYCLNLIILGNYAKFSAGYRHEYWCYHSKFTGSVQKIGSVEPMPFPVLDSGG
jgi:hypothetical protein